MPRQRKAPHPSTLRDPQGPGPQHGQAFPDPNPDEIDELFEDDEEDDDAYGQEDPDIPAPIQRQFDALRRENDLLKRAIPPAAPAAREQPPAEDEPDWDKMLFENPKEALALYGKRVADQVKTELRSEYQREQGTKKFWDEFYEAHDDLHPDHDLVESTLQKNLDELANLPVNKAMDRLADLTRTRIMGYSRRTDKPQRRKAVAEGANAPSREARPASQGEQSNVTTLTEALRANRAKRRSTAA